MRATMLWKIIDPIANVLFVLKLNQLLVKLGFSFDLTLSLQNTHHVLNNRIGIISIAKYTRTHKLNLATQRKLISSNRKA